MEDFNIELRELSPSEALPFRTKETAHKAKVAEYASTLAKLKTDFEREKLGLANAKENKDKAMTDEERQQDTDDLLNKGAAVQKKTLDATSRMQAKIADTEQVGADTLAQLAEDRKKLEGVREDLVEIDDGLKQSQKLITTLARKVARDKCIRALLIIVLVGVLVVIIWALIDPSFGKGDQT
eukprot:TRINITY_DN7984_c0_g1_i1.p1 TRINITY_DN7984_c0_g1~~TRINITY_DN7984_c0_g1_i1.p1  ORF type:complete len:182 (+),score=55.04 TRINITY_DN7984_c0_g1_i1:187-732(+)